MSDLGGGGPKNFAGEMKVAAGEAVRDFKDQVGQALEQGVQSVAGKQLTPQQIQQKREEEQKRLIWARKVIDYHKQTEAAMKKMREIGQQKEQQRLQEWEEKNKKDAAKKAQAKKRIISPAKANPQAIGQLTQENEELLRSKQELHSGRGIGG